MTEASRGARAEGNCESFLIETLRSAAFARKAHRQVRESNLPVEVPPLGNELASYIRTEELSRIDGVGMRIAYLAGCLGTLENALRLVDGYTRRIVESDDQPCPLGLLRGLAQYLGVTHLTIAEDAETLFPWDEPSADDLRVILGRILASVGTN